MWNELNVEPDFAFKPLLKDESAEPRKFPQMAWLNSNINIHQGKSKVTIDKILLV